MMRTVAISLALLTLLASPASAASDGQIFTPVEIGDAAIGKPLSLFGASFGFVDRNNDQSAATEAPQEPFYLDLDSSGTTTAGDIRLTPQGDYATGSAVDLSNGDLNLPLFTPVGWLARSADGTWYLDMPTTNSASIGDLRLNGAGMGTRVRAGDPDAGASLSAMQGDVTSSYRFGWYDANADQRRDAGEPVYLNFVRSPPNGETIDAGDATITSLSSNVDNPPTRDEFRLTTGWLTAFLVLNFVGLLVITMLLYRRGRKPATDAPPA